MAGCPLLLQGRQGTIKGSKEFLLEQEAARLRAATSSFSSHLLASLILTVPRSTSVLKWGLPPRARREHCPKLYSGLSGAEACAPRCVGNHPPPPGGSGKMRPSEAIQDFVQGAPQESL